MEQIHHKPIHLNTEIEQKWSPATKVMLWGSAAISAGIALEVFGECALPMRLAVATLAGTATWLVSECLLDVRSLEIVQEPQSIEIEPEAEKVKEQIFIENVQTTPHTPLSLKQLKKTLQQQALFNLLATIEINQKIQSMDINKH